MRFRLRLAKLYRAREGESCRRGARHQPRHGPNRSAVLELQWSPRTCVRRRPRSDRTALLHQLGRAQAATEIGAAIFCFARFLCWNRAPGYALLPARRRISCAGRPLREDAMSLGMILVIIMIIILLGGFSGRFGGYGYGMGHSGMGLGGVILIVLIILLLLGKL